jgi:hypothetical protein
MIKNESLVNCNECIINQKNTKSRLRRSRWGDSQNTRTSFFIEKRSNFEFTCVLASNDQNRVRSKNPPPAVFPLEVGFGPPPKMGGFIDDWSTPNF